MGWRKWVGEDEGWVGEDEGWVDGGGSASTLRTKDGSAKDEDKGWVDEDEGWVAEVGWVAGVPFPCSA